jgi:hypothetical protein
MKFLAYKHDDVLMPYDEEALEAIKKLPKEPIMISYTKVRSPQLHRWYFKFISVVYENLPESFDGKYPNKETFRKQMEMYAGHFETTINLKGEEMIMPKSIAFDKLDDIEFRDLITNIKNLIGKHIMPTMEIENEVNQFY